MKRSSRADEKEKRERAALERHARLHGLFVEDRFAFERERKRMIVDFINSVEDDDRRNDLLAMQASWDKRMKGAGSGHNRLVLAQTFFWEHFHEKWLPAMKKLDSVIKDSPDHKETKFKVI